jgi:hypothetical protein
MARSPLPDVRMDFADTVGWKNVVSQVAKIYDSLPAADRANAVILTDNYGEAGAIEDERLEDCICTLSWATSRHSDYWWASTRLHH